MLLKIVELGILVVALKELKEAREANDLMTKTFKDISDELTKTNAKSRKERISYKEWSKSSKTQAEKDEIKRLMNEVENKIENW